jgi:hypothetical protein
MTGTLTLFKSTVFAKHDGNFVVLSNLLCAASDAIDAVPLIAGMKICG